MAANIDGWHERREFLGDIDDVEFLVDTDGGESIMGDTSGGFRLTDGRFMATAGGGREV